jgi:hypothetical protein
MLNAMRMHIMRMINEDDKKRAATKKSKKTQETKKKSPVKKSVGWQYNSKTGRYEPTLAKSKRHNF